MSALVKAQLGKRKDMAETGKLCLQNIHKIKGLMSTLHNELSILRQDN